MAASGAVLAALAAVVAGGWHPDPVGAAATAAFVCTSTAGTTSTAFTVRARVPATVVQGSEVVVDDVVVSGTTDVDLWLASMTVVLAPPAGASSLDGLARTLVGPAATVPAGPVAPAGSTNETPPLSFRFRIDGAVGSTVDLALVRVDSVAAQIGDPSSTLAVACTPTSGGPFASMRVVAPSTPTTTAGPATTATTTAVLADALGRTPAADAAAAAVPVAAASPDYTG